MNIVIKKKSGTEKNIVGHGERTHECVVWSPTPYPLGHNGSEAASSK